ncbi:SHOCT domain-containing protein [Pseudomonas aeruginosa]|uniref:SHOCT domain-containing protein n=1 Tax=Pseudomonas aeruginosa TaxID=287 RepID=UPI00106AE244|nr:SHOCT domain-containing protein [Pseudomonas aeruginosa]
MNNEPLSSVEQSKIMIFALVMLPAIFFIVGIVPAIFLLFGTFMMKKNSDFSHVETAVKIFKGYVYLALTVAALCTLYFATTLGAKDRWERQGEEFIFSLIFVGVAVAYIILVNKLFLSPLADHADWVESNGIFSNKSRSSAEKGTFADIDIIKGEKMKSFSVADELIKWAKLKEDGHISDKEFQDARKKLLQRN